MYIYITMKYCTGIHYYSRLTYRCICFSYRCRHVFLVDTVSRVITYQLCWYECTPCFFSARSHKEVTDAVHQNDGKICMQVRLLVCMQAKIIIDLLSGTVSASCAYRCHSWLICVQVRCLADLHAGDTYLGTCIRISRRWIFVTGCRCFVSGRSKRVPETPTGGQVALVWWLPGT